MDGICSERWHPFGRVVVLGRREADLEKLDRLVAVVQETAPTVIVNAAAYTAVDKAENDAERAKTVNADAVAVLAREAQRLGAWMVHYSTDYVFDGVSLTPYEEDDATGPLSVYGRTKLAGEQALRANLGKHLIFRTSWVYANRGGNFAKTMLRLAKVRDRLNVVADQFGAPSSAALIAYITALALYRVATSSTDLAGTDHLTAAGQTSWHAYAQHVLQAAEEGGANLRVLASQVRAITSADCPTPAPRPCNSQLDTSKISHNFGIELPHLKPQVTRLIDDLASQGKL